MGDQLTTFVSVLSLLSFLHLNRTSCHSEQNPSCFLELVRFFSALIFRTAPLTAHTDEEVSRSERNPPSDLVCVFIVLILWRNRPPFTFGWCGYKENPEGGLRISLSEDERAGLARAAWPGSPAELTQALCSLRSFAPVSFEGSSHGSLSPNNDIDGACRKEDLRGILFPCAA